MTKELTAAARSTDELLAARTQAQVYARAHLKELAGDLAKLASSSLGAETHLQQLTMLCRKFGGTQARNCAVGLVNEALRDQVLATAPVDLDVDQLAQEIRRVDGSHSLGAGALAEALLPFLAAHGVRGRVLTAKDIREAFGEGYCAVQTYNDSHLSNVEDQWAKSDAKALVDAATTWAIAE